MPGKNCSVTVSSMMLFVLCNGCHFIRKDHEIKVLEGYYGYTTCVEAINLETNEVSKLDNYEITYKCSDVIKGTMGEVTDGLKLWQKDSCKQTIPFKQEKKSCKYEVNFPFISPSSDENKVRDEREKDEKCKGQVNAGVVFLEGKTKTCE